MTVVTSQQIARAAKAAGVDPRLFARVVNSESRGSVNAVSPAGAIGPAQLMPGTAAELGVDPRDPDQNLVGGARYLRQQLDRFGGDTEAALIAYNAGPGNADRWLKSGRNYSALPKASETQPYVRSILGGGSSKPLPDWKKYLMPIKSAAAAEVDPEMWRKYVDNPPQKSGAWEPPAEAFAAGGDAEWQPPAEAFEPGVGERFATGVGDTVAGAAQLASHLIPDSVVRGVNDAMAAIDDTVVGRALGKALGQTPRMLTSDEIDANLRQREQDYQARRGPDAGFDWARTGGAIASTVAIPGSPLVAGAAGAALQPATGPNFWTEKAAQTAVGGAAGAAAGALTKGALAAIRGPRGGGARLTAGLSQAIGKNAPASAVDDAAARMADDPGLTVAEALGKKAETKARVLVSRPGESRELAESVLEERAAGTGQRLISSVRNILGGKPYREAADELAAQMKAKAGPLYEEAYQTPTPYTKELDALLKTDAAKRAIPFAKRIGSNEGADTSKWFDGETPPDTRQLHYLRKGIDEAIDKYRDQTTGVLRLTSLGRSIAGVRGHLSDILKPALGKADAEIGEPKAIEEALEAGKNFVNRSPDDVVVTFRKFTPAQKAYYRIAVADAIETKIGRPDAGRYPGAGLLSANMAKKLKTVFPEVSDADQFIAALKTERGKQAFKNYITSGSRTAVLASDMAADAGGDAIGAATEAAMAMRGSTWAAGRLAQMAYKAVDSKAAQAGRDQLGRVLFSSDPQDLLALDAVLKRHEATRAANEAIAKRIGAAVGTGIGNSSFK